MAGCHCASPPPPATRPVEILKKPAINLSRGGAGFPVATSTPPQTIDDLRTALTKGYDQRLEHPELTKIDIQPGAKPATLRLLSIDLTGNTVRPSFVPKNPPKDSKPVGTLYADRVIYIADPLRYDTYAAGMRLEAKNAELEMIPAGEDTLALNLVDCHTGRAIFDLSVEDLRQSLSSGVNIKRSPAFMIDSVDLSLSSTNSHSLSANVLVHSRVLFVPATFRLTGRIDIDPQFNVHFIDLLAEGTDPTGMLVADVVQQKLDKVNGKAAPLLKMPGDKIHVSSFSIDLTNALRIEVGLAGTR